MARRTAQIDEVETPSTGGPLEALEAARATLAHWEQVRVDRETELAALTDQAGAAVLADPASAEQLPAAMRELRDAILVAQQAADAQRPVVAAAESAFLLAEAERHEALAEAARSELSVFDAKEAKLRTALDAHVGYTTGDACPRCHRSPLSTPRYALELEVQRAELRVRILRDLAAGEDPHSWLCDLRSIQDGSVAKLQLPDLYPGSVWGPDAVVPAPAFTEETKSAAQVVADLEQLQVTLPEELRHLEHRLKTPGLPGPNPNLLPYDELRAALEMKAERLRARVNQIPGELGLARKILAAKTGTASTSVATGAAAAEPAA